MLRQVLPTRVGAPPKFLMMCRTAEPFSKLYTDKYMQPDGGESRVEVLCNGQQFIAFGVHPKTGKPYEWFGGDPLNVPVADLPEVSRDQVVDFLRAADAIMASQPGWAPIPKVRANYEDRERYSGEPTDWARLERALDALTDVSDYDTFYRIIAALKDGTDDRKRAYALAFRWAAGYPQFFDAVGLQKKWDSFKRGGGAGLGTIFYLAREAAEKNQGASGFDDVSPKALLLPSADFVKGLRSAGIPRQGSAAAPLRLCDHRQDRRRQDGHLYPVGRLRGSGRPVCRARDQAPRVVHLFRRREPGRYSDALAGHGS